MANKYFAQINILDPQEFIFGWGKISTPLELAKAKEIPYHFVNLKKT